MSWSSSSGWTNYILYLYIEYVKFQRLAFIATEILSDETKSSGSIPSPHPVHSFARILKWPSYRILWSDLKKRKSAQLEAPTF